MKKLKKETSALSARARKLRMMEALSNPDRCVPGKFTSPKYRVKEKKVLPKPVQKKQKKIVVVQRRERKPSMYVLDIPRLEARSLERPITSTVKRAIYILNILKKYNYQCANCRRKERLTIDHYYRPANGRKGYWKYNIKDCIVLCDTCHMVKNGWLRAEDLSITDAFQFSQSLEARWESDEV